jgi:predicted nucleic acid-binding protein
MKTTIEIPDRLFRKAKSKAAERGQTLKEFMAEALREKLASNARDARPGEPAAYEACLNSQLSHFDILAVTEQTSVAFAALRVAHKRSGRPIPANDAWIAALALQHRLPVLSRSEQFDVVPNLARTGW